MPTAWRLTEATFGTTAFDGEGSQFSRGRWHSPGTRIVYTGGSRALAVLEVLARLGGRAPRTPYVLIPATFPDHAGDMTGLLAAADKALFGVKEKGRDAVESYLLLAAE